MNIEKLATSAVVESISKTDVLDPFVNDGDKEPSWDGNVYIYVDKRKAKKGIKRRIKIRREKNKARCTFKNNWPNFKNMFRIFKVNLSFAFHDKNSKEKRNENDRRRKRKKQKNIIQYES